MKINTVEELYTYLDSIDDNYECRLTKSMSGYKLYIRFRVWDKYNKYNFNMKKAVNSVTECLKLYSKQLC